MLSNNQQVVKRVFDVIISFILLLILIIPLILLLVFVALYFKKPPIFIQERIGKDAVPFSMYKIRTLKGENHESILAIEAAGTSVGRWLRRSKLDEIPQLWNVITGKMSLVGPRPDVKGYADLLEGDDRIILTVPPGITGPASIKYKNEDQLLLQQQDPNRYNDQVIWKDKVQINKVYIQQWNLIKDIRYILASLPF